MAIRSLQGIVQIPSFFFCHPNIENSAKRPEERESNKIITT
jgi:hypothetical protein